MNTSINYNGNTDCAREFTYPSNLGNFWRWAPPLSTLFGHLAFNPFSGSYSPFGGSGWFAETCLREVVYDNTGPGATTNFNTAYPLTLGITLPDVRNLSCCAGVTATVVLKFSVEDVNCNICDFFFTKDNIALHN